MKSFIAATFIFLFIACGCNSQSFISAYVLTDEERHYCDSLKIDSLIVVLLRTESDSTLTPFPATLDFVLNSDFDIDSSRKLYPGFLFNAVHTQTENIVNTLYDKFKARGYTIFTLDQNFGFSNKPDIIAILQCTDKYQILKQVQTHGINWNIDNDSLIKVIGAFDKKYSLELLGAGDDWCEFRITKEVKDWEALAKEAYKVCPDIVDQGAETVTKLAAEMKRTNRLYFWWD